MDVKIKIKYIFKLKIEKHSTHDNIMIHHPVITEKTYIFYIVKKYDYK